MSAGARIRFAERAETHFKRHCVQTGCGDYSDSCPLHKLQGVLDSGIKRPEREAIHSPKHSAEVLSSILKEDCLSFMWNYFGIFCLIVLTSSSPLVLKDEHRDFLGDWAISASHINKLLPDDNNRRQCGTKRMKPKVTFL
jgi:hypothetical protein